MLKMRACSLSIIVLFLFLTAAAALAGQPGQGGPDDGLIAVFPFESFSEEKGSLAKVIPVLRSRLEKKGYALLDDESLNKFLIKERVRHSGYLSKDLARKMGSELRVKAILLGSVNVFSAQDNPVVGISARLIDSGDGRIVWANNASATGEDFTSLLGLGRIADIERLVPKVVDRLVSSFSTDEPRKEVEAAFRIAVMPFQNRSKARNAGMITTYITIGELFKSSKFIPVEYGDVRKSVVDLRLRQKGELDYKSIDALYGATGVDAVLIGTVEAFSDRMDAAVPPEVAISLRLVDAKQKRILWYDSFQLDGDDNIVVLDFGRLRSVDKVASQVISKIIKKMERAKWF